MNPHIQKAFQMMRDAKPASGFRPQTEAEWEKLQRAVENMSYVMLRVKGMQKKDARNLAHLIHGGQAGRLILEHSFREHGDV
jgi:hypothetical protein